MDKNDFIREICALDTPSDWGYKYDDNCTDEWTASNKQRRTSHYALYMVHKSGGRSILLESGYIRITHEKKKDQLIKKYSTWAKSKFNPLTNHKKLTQCNKK